MAITLTPAAAGAVQGPVTRPLYLIEIGAGLPARLSTGGNITWRGVVWSGGSRVVVSGISASVSAAQAGRISIGNARLDWGALLLNDSQGAPVKIWSAQASALGDDDSLLVFDGVIDSADVSIEAVEIALATAGDRVQFSPRRVIGPDIGLTVLLPAGSRIPAGGQIHIIER